MDTCCQNSECCVKAEISINTKFVVLIIDSSIYSRLGFFAIEDDSQEDNCNYSLLHTFFDCPL
eukprot:m.3629 g.3629  ORF g.3629 m.3629 type:complete len:63 (+) comp9646_c0_seq1:928-1116(+)